MFLASGRFKTSLEWRSVMKENGNTKADNIFVVAVLEQVLKERITCI